MFPFKMRQNWNSKKYVIITSAMDWAGKIIPN